VAGIWDILSTESFSGYFGGQQDLVAGSRYRPLSIVSFAIEQSIFGSNTFERHLVNVILYGLLGLLLFRILSILLPDKEKSLWLVGIPDGRAFLFISPGTYSRGQIKGESEIMIAIGALGTLFCPKIFTPPGNDLVKAQWHLHA
jgi:hypothetical protein